MDYTNCIKCGILLDPETEAVYHNGEPYCFDHYEEIIAEEQDEEYSDD